MDLDLNKTKSNMNEKENIEGFIRELTKALENYNDKNDLINLRKKINNIQLNSNEEIEYTKKEFDFLHNYFSNELSDTSKGEIFLVTNKYENDNEYHRYKVTQYKNNLECKYIAFEKDLPKDVQLGDIVRKINGIYIYDKDATLYINEELYKIKQDIINNR